MYYFIMMCVFTFVYCMCMLDIWLNPNFCIFLVCIYDFNVIKSILAVLPNFCFKVRVNLNRNLLYNILFCLYNWL